LGLLNITTDNESVHCLLIRGALFLNKHNLIMFEAAGGVLGDITEPREIHPCYGYPEVLRNFGNYQMIAAPG
jgi:hypothetical protein